MTIDRFTGKYFFLSNFYPCRPGSIHLDFFPTEKFDARWYPTVEHAFQAAKTKDPEERRWIWNSRTAGQAKLLGQKLTLRPDWDTLKNGVMFHLLTQKFKDPQLEDKLRRTADARLIEGNTWHDNYWGDCKCNVCASIPGKNQLGELLEATRTLIVIGSPQAGAP